MKLTTSSESLRSALATAQSVLPSKVVVPVLANILLEADAQGLTICAASMDLRVTLRTAAKVGVPGACTVPAKKFIELVRQLEGDEVQLSLKGDRLTVESGRTQTRFVTLPADQFPQAPELDFSAGWGLPGQTLADLVARTSFAVSQEENRPTITGVFWTWADGVMKMVSTDGHRLAFGSAAVATGSKGTVIVPPKALALVRKLAENDREVRVTTNGNQIGFEQDGMCVASRLIDGDYPPWEKVVPKANDKVARFDDSEALKRVLRRLQVTAAENTGKIVATFSDDLAKFSAETMDLGTTTDELPMRLTGSSITIAFNVNYLLQALEHMPSEAVELTFNQPTSAALLRPVLPTGATDPSYFALVMPLRLD